MAYAPVQLFVTPQEDYAAYWVKFFEQGTVTPLSMATDSTGGTLIAQAEISSGGTVPIGFIKTAGDALLNPFIDGDYDAWLFPTEAEATANDTTNAIQVADNLNTDPGQDADTLRADLASTATDDGTKGFNLVSIPPISGESNIENHAFARNNVLRFIPWSLHTTMQLGTNTTSLVPYVQNFIDSLPSDHVEYVFPPGYTYYLPAQVSFDADRMTVIAYGAEFTSDVDAIMFELNDGADLTDLATMNATLNREVRWKGGHFVNTAATQLASIALNGTLFRQLTIEPEVVEGFWKGANVAGRDTIRLNNGRYFNNVNQVVIPSDLMGSFSNHQILNLDGVHFSAGALTSVQLTIRGSTTEIDIGKGSFNSASLNDVTDILIDNVGAFETNSVINIGGHFEGFGTNHKGIYFKNSNPTYFFQNINIDNCHLNINGTGSIGVDLENCRGVKFGVNRFRQTIATSTASIHFDDNCDDIEISRATSFSDLYPSYDTVSIANREKVTYLPEVRRQTGAQGVTGYDGDTFTTGNATIDMSSAISAVFPAEDKPIGYMIGITAKDSASAGAGVSGCRVRLARDSTVAAANPNDSKLLDLAGTPNSNLVGASIFVPCDENGDIYIDYVATGAGTLTMYMNVDAIYM